MSTERSDVVVIGAGLAGSAAAWALARRGRSVVVLEAFPPGHRLGSSHGSARIFRRAYPDPLYVRLTGEARRGWRELADAAGEELILTTGAIDFGPAREQEKMCDILTAFGVPAELMPGGGRRRALAGHVVRARAGHVPSRRRGARPGARDNGDAGGRRRGGRAVPSSHPGPAGGGTRGGRNHLYRRTDVAVADRDRSRRRLAGAAARRAGPATAPSGDPAGRVPRRARGQPGPWPAFIYHDEIIRYGLPAGRDGEVPGTVKLGEHGHGTVTTADGRDGIVSPAARDRIRAFIRPPAARPEPRAGQRGDLPVHLDRQRGFHPGPAGTVRDLLALLWPRRQVRAAGGRDRRRSGLWRAALRTRASPSPPTGASGGRRSDPPAWISGCIRRACLPASGAGHRVQARFRGHRRGLSAEVQHW